MSSADFPSMGVTLFIGLTAATLITYKPPPVEYVNPLVTLRGTGFVLGPAPVPPSDPIPQREAAPYLRPVIDVAFVEPDIRVEPMAQVSTGAAAQTVGINQPDLFTVALIAPERSATRSIAAQRYDPLQGMEPRLAPQPSAPPQAPDVTRPSTAGIAPNDAPLGVPGSVIAGMVDPELSSTQEVASVRFDALQGLRPSLGLQPIAPTVAPDVSRPRAAGLAPAADAVVSGAPAVGGNTDVATLDRPPGVTGGDLIPEQLQALDALPVGLNVSLVDPGRSDETVVSLRLNKPAEVRGEDVRFRRAPTTNGETIGKYGTGTPAILLERRDDGWALVVIDGVTAWMFGRFVVPLE